MSAGKIAFAITGASGALYAVRTLSELLARSVHVEADRFFESIKSGFVDPWKPESHEQNTKVMRIVGDVAAAYAAVTPYYKAPIAAAPKRWNVWAAAFGGSNSTNGDPNGVGSANFTARTGAVAAGVDYRLTPDTMIGVALAGGGTSWGLAQGLGSGHSDAFQAGLYGSQRFGAWYVSAAAAFANYWASTTRNLTLPAIDTLNANRLSLRLGHSQSHPLCGVPGAELLDAELQRSLGIGLQSVRAQLRVAHRQYRARRVRQLAEHALSAPGQFRREPVRPRGLGA